MTEELGRFIDDIVEAGGQIDGPIVYSLNNVPKDGIVAIEFLALVVEDYLEVPDTYFTSYFEIKNCIYTTLDRDHEDFTEDRYARLIETLTLNNMAVNTPFYHLIPEGDDKTVVILLGYAYE